MMKFSSIFATQLLIVLFICSISNFAEEEPQKLPRVADPQFPPLPYEFQLKVQKSCRNLLYIENRLWALLSDRAIINVSAILWLEN